MFINIGWLPTFYIFQVILAIAVIFLERRDPTATLAWVLVLLVFPGIGFLAYIFLAQNFSRKKLFTMKVTEKKRYGDDLKTQQDAFKSGELTINDPKIYPYKDMIKMNLFSNDAFYSQDNEVKIFTDGKEKFEEVFKCIEEAEDHIHILYYIIKNDDLGKKLIEALTKKAKEGVEVRLLYDSLGGRTLNKKSFEELIQAGGKVSEFFAGKIPLINFKINYRNHRKIIVIDSNIGFIGGFNVGNEYLGLSKRFGYWRDTHLKITGSAVSDLQTRFLLDWRNASKEDFYFGNKYFAIGDGKGNAGIQIITSGPDSSMEQIKQNYVKMINSARRSIYIQSPYFIPDASVMEALKIAALSGIDIRIMIPNMPDHPFVYWATYCHAGELLRYGVKVYTYENGFLHAKTIVVDDTIASVGTANFDVRSFKLNFEANALIYNSEVAYDLQTAFLNDIDLCYELTRELYLERRWTIKFKESVSRLLSPLL